MYSQHRNKYLETTIQTASPAQLLIMLYDGAIRFCRAGIEAIKSNHIAEANTNLLKTQEIINEFIITLDQSSPLAENLLKLYEYYKYLLTEANLKKDVKPAEEVLGYLIEMKETWVLAAKQLNQSAASAGGSTNGSYAPATRSTFV